ncbi:hypothetical protein L7F22_041339 [Adiantum nelumboides]|nr:hypothetical protein [Adiantum nelumboides]
MAKAGSSSRFVSVNLSKSYGQPSSPSPGHGSSTSSVPGSSSSGYRARLQSSHSGMIVLSRPGRSQSSVSSISSRTSKLAIPRPVNLPSLRREHAGNDPTVPLVGMSGSNGWSKQQVLASSGDGMTALHSIPGDSAAAGSSSMTSASSWSFPASQAKAIPVLEGENMEQRASFSHSEASSYQAPSAKSSLYTPPSSRKSNAVNLHPLRHGQPSEKIMVVRGEDFPTLQAAVRPVSVPAIQRQRDMQQKQRDKQHELKDQHVKLRQLSQQQFTKVDVAQSQQQYAGPPLQPSRLQHDLPKQPFIPAGTSYDGRRVSEKVANRFNGPSPLIRLSHTSNWDDDERETLQSAYTKGSMQSDRLETGRPRNGYHLSDWALDRKVDNDAGRPTLQNGSASMSGRGYRDSRDSNRNGGAVSEGRISQETNFISGANKGLSSQQVVVDSWEDTGSWGRGLARSNSSQQDLSYSPKKVISNRDTRLGKLTSSSNSNNMGSTRDIHLSSFGDVNYPHKLGTYRYPKDTCLRDGSNRLDVESSKPCVDDRQGDRIRKSVGGYQYGRSDLSNAGGARSDLLRLDYKKDRGVSALYGRSDLSNAGGARSDLLRLDYKKDRGVSALYGHDPFTDEPRSFKTAQSVFEAFVGLSGFEAKITKKKKDELSIFHDPARELFEAELERVEKMQEQERQRVAEEREKAVELARKEEEERERLTREEELLHLKLEQEEREAVIQAQREQEEAARMAEKTRRAREEQKLMIIFEEDRRKEAAKKKLLELEQRIALRESGRVASTSTSFFERDRAEHVVRPDEHRGLQRLDKVSKNEDLGLSGGAMLVQIPIKKEFMDGSRPTLMPVNSARRPFDSRGGENRVVQMTRRETLDDRLGLHSMMKYPHHLAISSQKVDHRNLSLPETSTGPNRSFQVLPFQNSSTASGQERDLSFTISRKEHQQSGYGERFSGDYLSTPLSTDINKGYMNSQLERDSEACWGRDRLGKFQEGHRLNSPPLFSYSNGGEADLSSFSRRRLSMPRQPKVPRPIFGWPSSCKPIIQSETDQALFPMHSLNGPDNVVKDSANYRSQEMALKRTSENAEHVHKALVEAPTIARPVFAPLNDTLETPETTTKLFDETAGGFGAVLHACKSAALEPDEIDQFSEQLSDLTESEEQSREGEKQAAADMEVREAVAYADEEDGWVVQGKGKDIDEEACVPEMEAVQADLEEQEWDSLVTHKDAKSSLEHGTEQESDESISETQHVEEQGSCLVDDVKGAADPDWERDQLVAPMTGKQHKKLEGEMETLGPREVLKDGPIELQKTFSSARIMENGQVGQLEGRNHAHPFIHKFQQPFSFMAVPLPQSTTMNGVPLHPPMLPPIHNIQSQQDISYPLHMRLFPSAPLMPNAIQIGSIQMPLQVHPQMPPVAHHHQQQQPAFQFGQICQFSQPMPPMQPAFQMQHALVQPLMAQHHQADYFSSKESSYMTTFTDPTKELTEVPGHSPYGSIISLDGSAHSILDGSLVSKDCMDRNSAASLVSSDLPTLPLVKLGPTEFSAPGADVKDETNQDTSVGKILGGRRRTSNARSNGVYRRGRGRLNGPYSVVEASPESAGKEGPRNRTHRQNIRRPDHKIRKLSPTLEQGPELGLNEQLSDVSYDKPDDAVCGLENAEQSAIDDRLDSQFRETVLQGDLGFVFKQQGSEVLKDFTEVHSKRNLLLEQHEMSDKAKIEELKVKEQIVSKQPKVTGKDLILSPGQNSAGRWSVPIADVSKNDGLGKHSTSMIGTNLCVMPNSMSLSAAANEPKVFKSSQCQSVAVPAHADTRMLLHGYSIDSTPTINAAWGVKKSSYEVASLPQTQLQEAVRPFGYSIAPQMGPSSDRGPTTLEPGASISPSKVSASVKTPVSMPGPISSLLAGEKIQFGAVTSPTVISSSTHPPSPFIGAIDSQYGSDKTNFSSHYSSLPRNYARQNSSETFLSNKDTPRVEDDVNGQLVDAEAEAMAAASAVAVAAISNDEATNSYNDKNAAPGGGEPAGTFGSFSKSSGFDGLGAGLSQTPSNTLEVDNTIAVALPADLSLEAASAPPQPSLPLHSVASDTMPEHLTRASSFPCLEMGTIMGGPIFAYGPRDDAAFPPFEPGLAGLGAGSVAGWQHRLSNPSDSFYGAPMPFMSAAGLPSIQGQPHMLVYTNPFSPVGQFGQLGVSFVGTTYHPSGKQPDWTHTPYLASPASVNQSGGDVNSGKPSASDVQHSALASNSPQAISAAGCSMMPVPAPISGFEPNFTSPFQVLCKGLFKTVLFHIVCKSSRVTGMQMMLLVNG